MRKQILLAAAAILVAGPALAQQAPRHGAAHPHSTRPARTGESPNDRGPFTPEANAAYQGGGVVLESAPGGPPPVPRATPPGQTPVGMVPPR